MMREIAFMVTFLCLFTSSWAQSTEEALINNVEPFTYAEVMPAFEGGQAEMYKFIYENITYPAIARENNIQGMVIVQYVVDVDSLAKRIKIVKGIGAGCDQEVVRVMQLMNEGKKWIPGRHNGRAVPITFVLPVTFKLEGPKEKKLKKKK